MVPEHVGRVPLWLLAFAAVALFAPALHRIDSLAIHAATRAAAHEATALPTATPDAEGWVRLGGGLADHAPAGLPDFDQHQGAWRINNPFRESWTHDGPVAAVNALWWLDSLMEPAPVAPPEVHDGFDLLTAQGDWDDHDPQNVPYVVSQVARAAHTNGASGLLATGTCLDDLERSLGQRLAASSERQHFALRRVERPTLQQLAAAMAEGQPAILLLGLWQHHRLVDWQRLGGHYVTLSGVDDSVGRVQIADPYRDGPALAMQPPAHNDAALVEHDPYVLSPSMRPGPYLRLNGYFDAPVDVGRLVSNFAGLNTTDCHPGDTAWLDGAELEAHIEAMLVFVPLVPATDTPTPEPTATLSPSETPADMPTPTLPISATATLSPTSTVSIPPSETATEPATETATPRPTATGTATAAPSATPTTPPTATATLSATPTERPEPTETATSTGSEICGEVVNSRTGQPVVAANVGLRQGDALVAQALSDTIGHFCLPKVPAGLYALSVVRSGCSPHSEFVETAGSDMALDVALACAPPSVYLPFALVPRKITRGR
jgi:hypothetical protein